MAVNNNGFIYRIDPYSPNGKVGAGESFADPGASNGQAGLVNETSPTWILTFVRWENRDTLRISSVSPTQVRTSKSGSPLVVESDCVDVTVTSSKGSHTPVVEATLVMTDINYETAIAPGDFMFVNMLNWSTDSTLSDGTITSKGSRTVANQARAQQAINGADDGFKGIFKVQSVRRVLNVDPEIGTKGLVFKITGYAFTEFNNTIYFNNYLLDNQGQDQQNQLLFASFIGNDWKHLINQKGLVNIQDIIAVLIQSFIGTGINDQGFLNQKSILNTPNVHFLIPNLVGTLLGVQNAKAAKDVYNFLFGIQSYSSNQNVDPYIGVNPVGLSQKFNRFYYTNAPCSGDSFLKPEYWNQVKSWAIINQYTNSPLNELFTCFRLSPNNDVMPTVVFRQIPFTTEDYPTYVDPNSTVVNGFAVTRFMNLPRWKINPSLVLALDIGREEAARVNFVQYFGRSTVGITGADIAAEIAQKNYVYDVNDVQRSGLRPYIVTTQFDEPTELYKNYKSAAWSRILGDALIGSHLKLNGTLECAGIVDPIAVGDNLEFDGIIYHIEQITHHCAISRDRGIKSFRTTISLSSGVSIESKGATQYAQMENPLAIAPNSQPSERLTDYQNNQILPGVSEAQDVVYRTKNVDTDDPNQQELNNQFPEPGGVIKTKPGDSV